MEDDSAGLVELHHAGHHGDEDSLVAGVVDAVTEGEVEAVVFAAPGSDIPEVSCAGEILPVLVEADRHHSVRGVERLLHSISVVDVDINVENPLVVFQQLQDGQDNVVDVAEAGSLALLGVMQTSGPIDGDVGSLERRSMKRRFVVMKTEITCLLSFTAEATEPPQESWQNS